MFQLGDIITDEKDYMVVSNGWINNNLRGVLVVPAQVILKAPTERRRTHLVVHGQNFNYLVHCEDIQLLEYDKGCKRTDTIDKNDVFRVKRRVGWMLDFGGNSNAKRRQTRS